MSKSILQIIQSCSVQKTSRKNTKYSRNESFLKIGHHAKAIGFAKSSLWVQNENLKKHVKIHSTNHLELLCAKNRSKNAQYSRNETILKTGQHKEAIAFGKWFFGVQDENSKTTRRNRFCKHIKNRSKNTKYSTNEIINFQNR